MARICRRRWKVCRWVLWVWLWLGGDGIAGFVGGSGFSSCGSGENRGMLWILQISHFWRQDWDIFSKIMIYETLDVELDMKAH